jgi:hypothetical protein
VTGCVHLLQYFAELLRRHSQIEGYLSQKASPDFLVTVTRNYSHPTIGMLEDQVASMNSLQFEAEFGQRLDNFPNFNWPKRQGSASLWQFYPQLLKAYELGHVCWVSYA